MKITLGQDTKLPRPGKPRPYPFLAYGNKADGRLDKEWVYLVLGDNKALVLRCPASARGSWPSTRFDVSSDEFWQSHPERHLPAGEYIILENE